MYAHTRELEVRSLLRIPLKIHKIMTTTYKKQSPETKNDNPKISESSDPNSALLDESLNILSDVKDSNVILQDIVSLGEAVQLSTERKNKGSSSSSNSHQSISIDSAYITPSKPRRVPIISFASKKKNNKGSVSSNNRAKSTKDNPVPPPLLHNPIVKIQPVAVINPISIVTSPATAAAFFRSDILVVDHILPPIFKNWINSCALVLDHASLYFDSDGTSNSIRQSLNNVDPTEVCEINDGTKWISKCDLTSDLLASELSSKLINHLQQTFQQSRPKEDLIMTARDEIMDTYDYIKSTDDIDKESIDMISIMSENLGTAAFPVGNAGKIRPGKNNPIVKKNEASKAKRAADRNAAKLIASDIIDIATKHGLDHDQAATALDMGLDRAAINWKKNSSDKKDKHEVTPLPDSELEKIEEKNPAPVCDISDPAISEPSSSEKQATDLSRDIDARLNISNPAEQKGITLMKKKSKNVYF